MKSLLVLLVIFLIIVSVSATSATTLEKKGWSVSGNGFHRIATYNSGKQTSLLFTNKETVSISLEVPREFYIDVNELPKRSSLTVYNSETSAVESIFKFKSSKANAFIDIEGPSFRSKTVPKITVVTIEFYKSSGAATNAGKSFSIEFPVHCRYATPVGEIASAKLLSEKAKLGLPFPSNSFNLLYSQFLDLIKFEEHYIRPEFNLKFAAYDGTSAASVLDSLNNNHETKFVWVQPVGNAGHAEFVFWTTTWLIILAALSVIIAASLPVYVGKVQQQQQQQKRAASPR
jgi:hypothetical protein